MAQVAVCSQINTKLINTVWAERTVVQCQTVGFKRLIASEVVTLPLDTDVSEEYATSFLTVKISRLGVMKYNAKITLKLLTSSARMQAREVAIYR